MVHGVARPLPTVQDAINEVTLGNLDFFALVRRAEEADFWGDPEIKVYLLQLARRRAELVGIRPEPEPWPTQDHDHLIHLLHPSWAGQLADFHHDFWDWVYQVRPGVRPRTYVGVWGRGLGKTSSVELAVGALGALHRRSYALFVTRTAEPGEKKMEAVTEILTDPAFASRFPTMAQVKATTVTTVLGRTSKRAAEWSRTRLRTASGFTIESIGLEVAVRGIKTGDQRPDLVIFDDIDSHDDNPAAVQKMLDTIRRAIIPAGAPDVAFIYINNLVHENSIASRLAYPERFDPRERLFIGRHVSGPVPAVYDLDTEYRDDAGDGDPGYVITKGEPSWPSWFGLDKAQGALNDSNLHDFLREYQHETEEDGGVFSHIEFVHADLEEVPWGRLVTVQVWVDPATSSTDRSDSMGVSCAGIDVDGVVWVLFTWEQITSPTEALKKAIKVAYLYGASILGVETDTGGDAWKPVFREALREMKEDAAGRDGKDPESFEGVLIPPDWTVVYDSAKAGQTNKSKEERHKQLITPFERQRVILVRGTHTVLERALKRWPKKPLDGVDAFWWTWSKLVEAAGKKPPATKTVARRTRPRHRPQPRR